MSPTQDDSDWSDSDDDVSDVETSVLLGIPDGPILKQEDVEDAAVSRLAGYPAFIPTSEPSLSSAQCKNCSLPMELLVQLWCPFEESDMDRALYVFGCARGECQHTDGSIRAYRGLRFNEAYAARLEAKRVRRKEKQAAKDKAKADAEIKSQAAKVNPFSMSAKSNATGGLFSGQPSKTTGLGSQLFGAANEEPSGEDGEDASEPPLSDSESSSEESDESESEKSSSSLLQAPTSELSTSSPWRSSLAYTPAIYLSTVSEYLPPPKKANVIIDDGLGPERSGKSRKGGKNDDSKDNAGWDNAMEGYENSLDIDHVFERFVRRVEYEGEQCVRYELNGTPLPYARDSIFNALFPSSSTTDDRATVVSNAYSKVISPIGKRLYDPSSAAISPCTRCGGRRVFECQLMPNLIHVLQQSCTSTAGNEGDWKNKTDEERKSELQRILKVNRKQTGSTERGMEWGTCMIFSCEKDCCVDENNQNTKECWAEELVMIQWEE